MKNLIIIVFVLCSYPIFGQSNLIGNWDSCEDNTIIEITESSEKLIGTIKSSDNPKAKIGKVVLNDLKKADNHWEGKIYAAKRQAWYDAIITPKGDVLEIEISVGFFTKTVKWKRIE